MHKLTILFVFSIFLSACGQKGPLYHSQTPPSTNQDDAAQVEPKHVEQQPTSEQPKDTH